MPSARLLWRPLVPWTRRASMVGARRECPSSAMRSASPPLLIEDDLVDGAPTGVKVLTLNAPAKLNPMSVQLGEALSAAVGTLSDDPTLRAVLLTGAGRAFSAGGELSFLRERQEDGPEENAQQMREFYASYLSIRKLPVPLIAVINGPAVGAGLALALAADVRFTCDAAKFSFNFVGLGLHPGMGSTHQLAAIAGTQVASAMLLSAETINGAEAQRRGIVLRSLPDAPAARAEAFDLARRIAAQGAGAVRATVRTLRVAADEGLERALQREADAQAHSYATEEYAQRLQAVLSRHQ